MIVNLTPHVINVFNEDREEVAKFTSQGIARCEVESTKAGDMGGIPIFTIGYGRVVGLPDDPAPGFLFIVSLLVKQALPERNDLLSPGELLRDDKGQPIGCIGLNQ